MERPNPDDDQAQTQILDDAAGTAESMIDPEKTVVMDHDRHRRSQQRDPVPPRREQERR
ncbi:MAG TPA: hypothetical protein VF322_12580 [Gammaproteobacteria bacterium]